MKKINLILLVGVAIATGVLFTALFVTDLAGEASVYTDFASAKTSGEKVHVVGNWIRQDETVYDSDNDILDFWMQDSLQNISPVRFYDPMPPNFADADKIVVIGGYEHEVFVADKILMKCPSKYEPELGLEGATAMKP